MTEVLTETASSQPAVLHLMQHSSEHQAHAHQHVNGDKASSAAAQSHSGQHHHPQQSRATVVHVENSAPRSYTILKEVGDGSFGTVWLADWHSPLALPPGTRPPGPSTRPEYKGKSLVAIKRMKKAFLAGWTECLKLKELHSLRSIPMHQNIIPLYDAFLLPTSKELYFVFECMEGNLYQLTKSRKGRPLAGGLVASILHQILLGLHHVHSHGFFHRDMKPENLLITTTGLASYPPTSHIMFPVLPTTPFTLEKDVVCIVKLADFGLARETASKPPYTEYVSTRWYRAPEVLLRSRDYTNPVDLWALGTILAEMVTLKPLFPGQSEIDQVLRICHVLGDPVTDYGRDSRGRLRGGGTWQNGIKLAERVGFQWPKCLPVNLATLFDQNTVPPELIDFIASTLRYEPQERMTTLQALQHPYFGFVAPRLRPVTDVPAYQQLLLQAAQEGQQRARSLYEGSTNHSSASIASASSSRTSASQPHVRMHVGEDLRRHPHRLASAASTSSAQSMPVSTLSHADQASMHRNGGFPRAPTAASSIDMYDGSIFEGINPHRDYVNTGANNSTHTVYDDNYSLQLQMEERRQIREAELRAAQQQQQQQQQQQPQVQADNQSTRKSTKGWSLSSVFNPEPSASSLKRSTSQSVLNTGGAHDAMSPQDKKAKKAAEREAERAKREAASQLARERARAVMQNSNRLQSSSKDVFSRAPNYDSTADAAPRSHGQPPPAGASSIRSGHSSHNYLTEGAARIPPLDSRWKSRRRDDDDDILSISSGETQASRASGNDPRYSFSSYNTVDSDPMPKSPWSRQGTSFSRQQTGSSFGSSNRPGALDHFFQQHQNQAKPPQSSSSSVDSSLLQNFQGLSAADAQRIRPFGSASPALDSQHAMLSMTRPPGPGTTFVPALHSLGPRQNTATSYHSMPTLPSQQQQHSSFISNSDIQEDEEMQTDS